MENKKVKASQNKAKNTETHLIQLSLTIKERLDFAEILPERSDIVTQVLSRDIREKISFTQAEAKKFGMKPTPKGGLSWDKGRETNIAFTVPEITLMRAQVEKLDKERNVSTAILSLCLKIREIRS